MGKTKTSTKRGERVPIFARGVGKPIGYVVGDEFRKSIRGSVHILRRPRAIAFDTSTLQDAQTHGAVNVLVQDVESGKVYRASISSVYEYGFRLDRGHNEQTALPLERFSTTGAEQRQGSLFGA